MPHILAIISPRSFKDRAKVCAYLACALSTRGRVLAVDLDLDKRLLTNALLALEMGDMKTLFGILVGKVRLEEAIQELRSLNPALKVPKDVVVHLLPARKIDLYEGRESLSKLFKMVEMDELSERFREFLGNLTLIKGYDYVLVDSSIDIYPFTPRFILKMLRDVVILMEPIENDLNRVRDLKSIKDINIVQVILYKYDPEKRRPKPKAEESWEKLTSKTLEISEEVVVGIPGKDIYSEMLYSSMRIMETLKAAIKPTLAMEVGGGRLIDPTQLARILLGSELLEVKRVEASKCIEEVKLMVGDGEYYVIVSPKMKEWTLRLIYKNREVIEASFELKDKTLIGKEALKMINELSGEAFANIYIVK